MNDFLASILRYFKFGYQLLLFVASIFIISYFFPSQPKFKYEYQQGLPWMHEELIAETDFPIYKSEVELAAEKDSIRMNARIFVRFDNSVLPKQENLLFTRFEQLEPDFKSKLFKSLNNNTGIEAYQHLNDSVSKFFEAIYSKGIMAENQALYQQNKNSVIEIIKDNVAVEESITNIRFPGEAALDLQKVIKQICISLNADPVSADKFIKQLRLNELMLPNLQYDEEITKKNIESEITSISLTHGLIRSGTLIIKKGDVVTPGKYRVLESLKNENEKETGIGQNFYLRIAGKYLIIIASMLVLFLYLFHFRPEILANNNKTLFILLLVVIFISLAGLVVQSEKLHIYLIPFALIPIIIRTFYDTRLAIYVMVITILLGAFIAPNGFEFVFMNFISGILALFTLQHPRRRSQLLITTLVVIITYLFLHFSLSLMHENTISREARMNSLWLVGNGILILTSYPLIYMFEKLFGFTSDLSLMELSDTNNNLLRTLASEAPGTFQHSLQVANLAEEVIMQIGGNPLLVRTGALYHDIGKMKMAPFFIENQQSGFNPHDKLSFEESAQLIISHVSEGVKMAKKNNLPQVIINFIQTHHGTSTVQYFYRSFLKHYPEELADISRFTYPGPIPNTKETAVLMMADSIEAASRSLKEYTERSLNDLVDNIISYQQKEGQFDDAPITIKDITIAKQIFNERLRNIYHRRIEYPK